MAFGRAREGKVRTALNWAGATLASLAVVTLLLGAAYATYIAASDVPRYTPLPVELHVEVTPERVARGKVLVLLLCADCHKNPETRQLTGKRMLDAPPEFGRIFSPNITRHRTRGIGAWSDGQIAYLLRTGVRWDGRYIPPYMPKLPHLADEDLASLIAFLRSDDDLVRANDAVIARSEPSFATKALCRSVFRPLPYPTRPILRPALADRVAYGKYIVEALQCFACHSNDFRTVNPLEPERSDGYLGGGAKLLQMNGNPIYSSNLTADDETGIGRWSEDDFRRTLREGFRKDGSLVRYPMTALAELSDEEAADVYAYLRTVPKLRRPRRPTPPDPPYADISAGSVIYHRYDCQTCHGETGIAYGDTARVKYPSDDALIAFLRDPSVSFPGTRMPRWDGVIRADECAPLCAYARKLAAAK